MKILLAVAMAVFLATLPFGFWRAGVRKFAPSWFIAIHLPIPFIIALRILSGIGFHVSTIPVIAGAYCAGQYVGGAIRRKRAKSQ